MKKVKSLILKGMLAGMTLATGFGAVAPAMMSVTPIYAAESSVVVEQYDHILYEEAVDKVEAAKSQGNVLSAYDDTTTIEIDGSVYTYKVTRLKETSRRGDNGTFFFKEEDAYNYGVNHGWTNIRVTGGSCNFFYYVQHLYTVEGAGLYANLEVSKQENTPIQTISLSLDETTLDYEGSTTLHVSVNEGANPNQVVVESCNEEIATVERNSDGTYTVTVGNTLGTAMLKATATDGSGTTECTFISALPGPDFSQYESQE